MAAVGAVQSNAFEGGKDLVCPILLKSGLIAPPLWPDLAALI
jgi:hypothetical protein